MSLLFRGAELDGSARDILVEGDKIVAVGEELAGPLGQLTEIIDCLGLAAFPTLVNAHAHSAMTLFRGAAEDLELEAWLKSVIWPLEAKLTAEDIYWGTRLAALDMISTGTGLCQDMYSDPLATARAARNSGMRFVIDYALIDGMDEDKAAAQRRACKAFFDNLPDFGPNVSFNLAAHSVYATCPSSLRWLGEFGRERDLSLHIHLAETKFEIDSCKKHTGMSPVFYLDSLGFLGPDVFAAHALWLDAADFDLLAERGVKLVHNPASNMKLASGPAFDYGAAKRRGIVTLLGTDGSASNNGLDLFADMKLAALLQKHEYHDPTRFPLTELVASATVLGHEAFGDGAGCLEPGKAADFLLVDLSAPGMIPRRGLAANLVYAGGGGAVDTMVCAGKIIMRHRKIDGAEEVRAEAARLSARLAAAR
ncbi:MAG: amidohydrolase [Spirochaetes bacterium]|nr:amidohydrolase [Spirochaetota bacterium]